MMHETEWLKKTLLMLAVCVSVSACLQIFQQYFIYWRFSFFTEPWRWWTGHWVHVGWIHFLLNMLAFICLPFIFPMMRKRYLIFLLLTLAPCISFCFYFIYPDVQAYAGLSGVLHGLYVACALACLQLKKERKFSILVLVLVLLKIVWENSFGSLQTATLIGSPVMVEAHLMGVIIGAICTALMLSVQTLYPQKIKNIMFAKLE